MEEPDPYAWQKTLFKKWYDNGLVGVAHCSPASGKTRGGRICIERYLELFPLDRVWVIANTREVIAQWQAECKDIPDLEYFTYLGAVNRFEKLKREGKERFFPQMMILDECQQVMAKESGRVLNYGVKHYLGLSGTPNGAEKKLGGVIERVTFEQAHIADASVYLVRFQPTEDELDKYRKATASIDRHKEKYPFGNIFNDAVLSRLYLRRRQVTYRFDSRVDNAISIILKNKDRKVMVFCMLQDQAKTLSERLNEMGIDNTLHLSSHEGLSRFVSGETNICISCKKLSVGFSYVPADVAILVSTAISEMHIVQEMARVLRPATGKHADIYILVANDTTDTSLCNDKGFFIRSRIIETNINDIKDSD